MAYVINNRKYRKKLRKLCVEDVLHLKWRCKWASKICVSLLSGFIYIISLSVDGFEPVLFNRHWQTNSVVLTQQRDDSKLYPNGVVTWL